MQRYSEKVHLTLFGCLAVSLEKKTETKIFLNCYQIVKKITYIQENGRIHFT